MPAAGLERDEGHEKGDRDGQYRAGHVVAPVVRRYAREAVDEEGNARGYRQRTGKVETPGLAFAANQNSWSREGQQQADRYVHEHDPAP